MFRKHCRRLNRFVDPEVMCTGCPYMKLKKPDDRQYPLFSEEGDQTEPQVEPEQPKEQPIDTFPTGASVTETIEEFLDMLYEKEYVKEVKEE